MRSSLEPALSDAGRAAYWRSRWEPTVTLAAERVELNRKVFYWLRGVAVASAVIVPSLVGLNLAGTGGVWVRWITFALSLVAALSVALLALFRVGDRWFLYRDLEDVLLKAGWALVTHPGGDVEAAWEAFRSATERAITSYNTSYETEVIMAAQSVKDQQDGGSRN
jgi:hypothetical protein